MNDVKRDENFVPGLLGVSSVDGITPVPIQVTPDGKLLVDLDVTQVYTGGDGIDINGSNVVSVKISTGLQFNLDGELEVTAVPGSVAWGGVTGTLSDQTDLQTALDAKVNNSLVDAKGDLLAATADNTLTRFGLGTNGQVLTVDTSTATGLKWGTPAAGATAKNSIEIDAGDLQLVGDSLTPGNSKYYGTDPSGVKGFHTIPTGGTVNWGSVTGTLSDQTDLQTALNAKLTAASNLSDVANASTARTNLGLAIGTNVQAYDANLTTWAGKTAPTGTVLGTTDTQTLTNKDLSSTTNTYRAASLTQTGAVELANTSEIDTGTDTTRAIPVDQFVASKRNVRHIIYRVLSQDTDQAVDTVVGGDLRSPITGTIIDVYAYTDTAGVTGTAIYDINKNNNTIMTTNKIQIETGEKTSKDATTQPTLTTTALAAGDILTFDIDTIQSGTAAKGLTFVISVRES